MISVVSVYLTAIEDYVDVLAKSIAERTSLVKEVILANSVAEDFEETWTVNGIKFTKFGSLQLSQFGNRYQCSIEHALSLHSCLDRATQDYILFCDPDSFLYTDTDQFYMDMLNNYDLKMVGVSHNSATNHAFTFFPYVYNSLIKRSDLPGEDWMKGKLWKRNGFFRPVDERKDLHEVPDEPADGKYLLPAPIMEYCDQFPNKNGLYDTGCNMHLWFKENGWKWLSFQTTDCHLYTTQYYRGNFKMKDKLPRRKLCYHSVSGSACRPEDLAKLKEAYND